MNTPPAPSPLSASGRVAAATGRLSRHLALAYAVLIIYASLHPFSGWRDSALSPFAFLEAGWPRYWTGFDLAINVFAYLPLGFLLTLALRQLPTLLAAPTALLLGTLLSFSMESLQAGCPRGCRRTWIFSRIRWGARSAPCLPSGWGIASFAISPPCATGWHREHTSRPGWCWSDCGS